MCQRFYSNSSITGTCTANALHNLWHSMLFIVICLTSFCQHFMTISKLSNTRKGFRAEEFMLSDFSVK